MRYIFWPFEFFSVLLIPVILIVGVVLAISWTQSQETKATTAISLAKIEATVVADSNMQRLKLEELQQNGMSQRANLLSNSNDNMWAIIIGIGMICATVLFIFFYSPKHGNYLPLPKGIKVIDNNPQISDFYVVEENGQKLLFNKNTDKYLGLLNDDET